MFDKHNFEFAEIEICSDIVDLQFIRITIFYITKQLTLILILLVKKNFSFNFTEHIHVSANSKFKFLEIEINVYKLKFKVTKINKKSKNAILNMSTYEEKKMSTNNVL